MNLERITLIFYIGCFIFFAVPAFFLPEWFAGLLGYEISSKGSKMEFVAAYGGLILGVGFFLFYCLYKNIIIGLFSVLIIVGTLLFGRVVGYIIEGSVNNVQLFFLTIELGTVIFLAYVLYYRKKEVKKVEHK